MELENMKLYSAIMDPFGTDYEEYQQRNRQQLQQQQQRSWIRSMAMTKQIHQSALFSSPSQKILRSFSTIPILPSSSSSLPPIRLTASSSAPESSNSSPSISVPGYYLLLLLLLTSPVTSLALRGLDHHTSRALATPTSVAISCHRHFNHRIQGCVEPFTSLLNLYDRHPDKLIGDQASSKHICLEYKMVLLCLHSALTDCPTLRYVKRVQRKLSSHWVIRVNRLCAIQSNQAEQRVNRQYDSNSSGTKPRTHAHPYSKYATNDFGSQPLTNHRVVHKPHQNKAELMRHIDTRGNKEYRNRHFPTSPGDVDFRRDGHGDDNNSGHTESSEIVLHVVKLVQTFDYQTRTEQGKETSSAEHSPQTISDNSAFRNTPSLQMWILYVAALLLVLHLQ